MPKRLDPYYQWLGIPPDQQPPDAYRLLGIRPGEDDAGVIRTAAERQMAHLRTFQLGEHSDLSQRLLNEVAAARAKLLDPRKKADYDRELAAAAAIAAQRVKLDSVRRRRAVPWRPIALAGGAVLLVIAALIGFRRLSDWLAGPEPDPTPPNATVPAKKPPDVKPTPPSPDVPPDAPASKVLETNMRGETKPGG